MCNIWDRDALAVDGAAVESIQNGDSPAVPTMPLPARLRGLAHARIVELRVDTDAAVIREGLGDAALLDLVGHVEARVLHPDRIEQALLLELVEGLPRDHLDESSEHVGGVAVVPRGPWLIGEWQLGQPVHQLRVRWIVVPDLRLRVHLLDLAGPEESIGETRGMTEEILDGHVALGGNELERIILVRSGFPRPP
jgi:hypothetical protein